MIPKNILFKLQLCEYTEYNKKAKIKYVLKIYYLISSLYRRAIAHLDRNNWKLLNNNYEVLNFLVLSIYIL